MYRGIKRGMDITFSLVLLIVLSPLMLLVAVLIRADSEGGSLFTQVRTGRDGRPFIIYKFRTMRQSAPHDVSAALLRGTTRHVTRIGRVLRKTSIDELPQLFNVLKGDMSFVGPRPVVLSERELIRLRRETGADCVRPGLTGLAQVIDREMDIPRQKAYYDAWYAHNLSFGVDAGVLYYTARRLWK